MANVVAIVGRPNVGKSTLFNRLVERRQAIMDNQSGVTRDRHYGYAEWTDKHFTAIDTGGYVSGSDDIFEEAIRKQVQIAIDEASAIIFMVDCKDGLTGLDKDFANVLRRSTKPVFVAANKADTMTQSIASSEFYSLGMGEVYAISSATGSGTGELLDALVTGFPEKGSGDPDLATPRVAIVGRPNVGKSSFVNILVGEERSIVTDIPGTTRDSINTRYNLFGKDFILTDTAGIRKKSRVKENIEFYSVLRAIRAIEDCDICLVMLDAQHGIESQDINIISLAVKYKKGVLILVNKWDLITKDHKTTEVFNKEIREKLGPHAFIPVIYTSVTKKQRIFKVVEEVLKIYNSRRTKIPTSKLNEVLLKIIERTPPPALKGKYIKIKYITQLPKPTPVFIFFCNLPQYIKAPYQRFIENNIRKNFGFEGVPISLFFRKK